MKNFIWKAVGIFFILISFNNLTAQAQCTPSLPGPYGSIVPDTTTNLPTANAGVAYSTDIQVYAPHDTIAPGLGSVSVHDFTITSITGLPTGFTYVMNPVSGIIPGGSAACVRFAGTPSNVQAGTHELTVYLTAHVTFASIPVLDTVRGYRIVVIPSTTGLTQIDSKQFYVSQNYPNPISESLVMDVNGGHDDSFNLVCHDILGNIVIRKDLHINHGYNNISINIDGLAPGVYFYTASNSEGAFSYRFVVSAK